MDPIIPLPLTRHPSPHRLPCTTLRVLRPRVLFHLLPLALAAPPCSPSHSALNFFLVVISLLVLGIALTIGTSSSEGLIVTSTVRIVGATLCHPSVFSK